MRVMINLYKITQGIQNLITWFPIIWKDRQWDHYYLMVMLHKKLSLMEEHISKHRIHVGWERDVFKIKRCRLTLIG